MQACAPAEQTKSGETTSTTDADDDGTADCSLTKAGASVWAALSGHSATLANDFEDLMTVAACDAACAAESTCVLFGLSTTAAGANTIAYDTCDLYTVPTTHCEWEAEASSGAADKFYLPSKRWCDGAYDPQFAATYDSVVKIAPGTKPGETLNLWAGHGSSYARMSLEYSRVHHTADFAETRTL